jgi:LysR family transcriptional regulator, nitrogen assimilation regulatory protein
VRFRQLRHFCAILDCGSFSRAAATVHIAQPALSRQIAELEAQIGVQLLQRTARGVRATRAGEILYGEAKALLQRLDELPSLILAAEGTVVGSVRLGLSSIFDPSLATAIVAACREAMPQVTIKMIVADSSALRGGIEARELDLALIFENSLLLPPLARQSLFRQRLYFVASSNLISPSNTLSLKDIAALPLVVPSESDFAWALFAKSLTMAGLAPKIVAEVDDTPSLMSAVKTGLGGVILPMSKALDTGGKNALRSSLVEPPLYVTASVVAASDVPLTRAGGILRSLIVTLVRRNVQAEALLGTEWIL